MIMDTGRQARTEVWPCTSSSEKVIIVKVFHQFYIRSSARSGTLTPSRDPHHWKKDLTIEDICQFYSYVEHKEWNLDILFDSLRVPQSRGPEHFCDFGPSK